MSKINLKINNNVFNPIYLKHLKNDRKTQIYFGGASSGKSFFLTQKIVIDVLNGNNYLVVRKYGSTLKRSIFNEVTKAISFFKVDKYFNINKSMLTITCKLNKKQIIFSGLDDVEKLKSITPQDGVITRIFIEEATEIELADYKQLTKRLRGLTRQKKCIILAFNPVSKYSWIFNEFFIGKWDEDSYYYEDDDLSILKTTYKDNKFLTKDDRDTLEAERDEYWYDVYTLGNWGSLGKTIFRNWRIDDLTDMIPKFHNIRCGLDFGWNDPIAFVKAHLDQKYKKIYIFDEFCISELKTEDLITLLNTKLNYNDYVTCDSAEPRTINALRSNGISALEAKKGQGSIVQGIRFLQDYEIIIHKDCSNAIKEFTLWEWKKDKNGNAIEIPEDKHCHICDALRYSLEQDMLYSMSNKTHIRGI